MSSDVVKLPDLSVVVPSVNGWSDLSTCLSALSASRGAGLEILVVDRCGDAVREQVERCFPEVRILPAPPGTPIPDLRALGFAAARAPSVAVIEDHVLVPPDWARKLLAAQARGQAVVGGSVSNAATERAVDWAAFLCEYSHLLPPLAAGPAESLTGNNTVYRRELLERYRAETKAGRWEDHLHRSMRRDGVGLFCDPTIEVAHKKHYDVRSYSSQRYWYARSYAGARMAASSWPVRVVYAAAASVLPVVLLCRIVSRVAVRRRHFAELVKSLPLISLFVGVWAAGEMVGAIAGPGDSLSRVS